MTAFLWYWGGFMALALGWLATVGWAVHHPASPLAYTALILYTVLFAASLLHLLTALPLHGVAP